MFIIVFPLLQSELCSLAGSTEVNVSWFLRVFLHLLSPPPTIEAPDASGQRDGSVGGGAPDTATRREGKRLLGTGSCVRQPESDGAFSVSGGHFMRLSLPASEVNLASYSQRKLSIVP